MPWSNQGGGPWGSGGGKGPWGSGPQSSGPTPPDLEGPAAPQPGQAAQRAAGRQSRRPRLCADRARRHRAVGRLRLLPRRARRGRRRAALRQGHPRGPAGPQLSPAVSDRDRADAEGAAGPQDRRRHAHRRRSAPRHHRARRAGRKPDAHRRREHRRRRFLGAVADQAERRRRISVQHPEPRRHREGGGRKRHARGGRPLGNPADPDRRAAEHRGRGAGADAEDARQLRRRRRGPAGADAEGRSAGAGDRLLPRRAGGARRPRARAERGADLRQPRGAGGARPRGADPAGRRRLQVADRRRGDRPDLALHQDLRGIQEGARRDAQAHVSRNHGARAGRHRQDHPRFHRTVRLRRGALSAAQRAAAGAGACPAQRQSGGAR